MRFWSLRRIVAVASLALMTVSVLLVTGTNVMAASDPDVTPVSSKSPPLPDPAPALPLIPAAVVAGFMVRRSRQK